MANLKKWHKAVCERDGYVCQYCGKDYSYECYFQNGVNQYVCGDHIKTRGAHIELEQDINNGRCSCLQCHNKRHYESRNKTNKR